MPVQDERPSLPIRIKQYFHWREEKEMFVSPLSPRKAEKLVATGISYIPHRVPQGSLGSFVCHLYHRSQDGMQYRKVAEGTV